ncbi:MAG: chemotaxis protein CheA, partial [Clostridiales bacterium]|nr:chemotaxis protein CheA [Clostridiales bacterium]
MAELYTNEPMLDIYIFETTQNISQLETSILDSERSSCYTPDAINEIFRIMHTIKGSSAMMLFDNISSLAHSMEDLFYYIREQKPINVNCATLSDLVLEGVDFIKVELQKIKAQDCADGDPSNLIESIKEFLFLLKHSNPLEVEIETKNVDSYQQYYITHIKTPSTSSKNAYKADIFFEDGCEMENIRAYTLIQDLKEITEEVFYLPEDIMD